MREIIGVAAASGMIAIGAIICGISLFGANFAADERPAGVLIGSIPILCGVLLLVFLWRLMSRAGEPPAAGEEEPAPEEDVDMADVASPPVIHIKNPNRNRIRFDFGVDQ